jgi:D-proline reductase (dithiol) PrdB
MCNRAGGLISRVIESYGIPTISHSINRAFTEKIRPPRSLFFNFPYGAPFGEPGNVNQQMTVLRDLFLLLQEAKEPGVILDAPYKWRREKYEEVTAGDFMPKR